MDNSTGNFPVVIVAVVDAPYDGSYSDIDFVKYNVKKRTVQEVPYKDSTAARELPLREIFIDKQDLYEPPDGAEDWPLHGFTDLVKPGDALRNPTWVSGTSYALITLQRELFSDSSWERLENGQACLLVEITDKVTSIRPVSHGIQLEVAGKD
jgi:hypothetical protein